MSWKGKEKKKTFGRVYFCTPSFSEKHPNIVCRHASWTHKERTVFWTEAFGRPETKLLTAKRAKVCVLSSCVGLIPKFQLGVD